ncbi:MAG: YciI family protein [Pseudomonadota bacterium]
MTRNNYIPSRILGAAAGLLALSACASIAGAQEPPTSPPEVPESVRERAATFLNMELYVYETRLAGPPENMIANLEAHLDYQVMLQEQGIMFGAGPLYEENAATPLPVAGMIIVRAESFEEARAIADADPMHSSGARSYTLRKWTLNEGALDVTLKFSGQSFTLE